MMKTKTTGVITYTDLNGLCLRSSEAIMNTLGDQGRCSRHDVAHQSVHQGGALVMHMTRWLSWGGTKRDVQGEGGAWWCA